MSFPKTAAVVIAYNDPKAIRSNLSRIVAARPPWLTLLVFDNSPEQDMRDAVREAVPASVEYVTHRENLGYAGAIARLLPALFMKDFQHVIVLNQDLKLMPGAFEALVEAAEAPDVGVVGAITVDPERPDRVHHTGCRIRWPWLHTSHARSKHQHDVNAEGAAFLVTRRAYERVGNFDSAYFLYFEEIDYCERVRRSGLRVLVSQARIVHPSGRRGTPCAYWTTRNRIRFFRKHGRPEHLPAMLFYTLFVSVPAFGWICRPAWFGGMRAALAGLTSQVSDVRSHGFWIRPETGT